MTSMAINYTTFRSCNRISKHALALHRQNVCSLLCPPWSAGFLSRCEHLHLGIEIGLAFEAYAGEIRHGDAAVLDAHAIGETAIGLEQIRITLIAPEAEAGRDVQRHLVPAMRDAATWRPAVAMEYLQRALVFAEPVGQRAVELQPVAVRAHPTIADEIP